MEDIQNLENFTQLIYIIRHQKVMLDFDLATLYGTETKLLKRQVKRNLDRFPDDFMFQLNEREWKEVVPNWHHLGKARYTNTMPFAFTEQGIAMLSSVLKSKQAVRVNIQIMRAFINLRRRIISYEDLLRKLDKFEEFANNKLFEHENNIRTIFQIINEMITEDESMDDRKIGFDTSK